MADIPKEKDILISLDDFIGTTIPAFTYSANNVDKRAGDFSQAQLVNNVYFEFSGGDKGDPISSSLTTWQDGIPQATAELLRRLPIVIMYKEVFPVLGRESDVERYFTMNVVTPLVTLGRKLLEIGRIQDPQRRRYYLDAYDQAPVGKPGGGACYMDTCIAISSRTDFAIAPRTRWVLSRSVSREQCDAGVNVMLLIFEYKKPGTIEDKPFRPKYQDGESQRFGNGSMQNLLAQSRFYAGATECEEVIASDVRASYEFAFSDLQAANSGIVVPRRAHLLKLTPASIRSRTVAVLVAQLRRCHLLD